MVNFGEKGREKKKQSKVKMMCNNRGLKFVKRKLIVQIYLMATFRK